MVKSNKLKLMGKNHSDELYTPESAIDILLPYLRNKTIDKNIITNGVVIPPKCDIGIEGYMEKLGVEYTITVELPGKYDGQKRTAGGIAIINSILKNFKEIK